MLECCNCWLCLLKNLDWISRLPVKMFKTSNSFETLSFADKDAKDEMTKGKCVFPELVWLPEDRKSEKFTFPQVSPSLLLQETPFSLDSKVPLIPALDDVMVLCTTKLGMKRFQSPEDADFDMRTPNSPSLDYNFLHDPHLKKYLSRPSVRKSLINQGLITDDGFVKCSPKEFNEFRQWIRRLKLNSMEASAKNTAEQDKEQDDPKSKLTEHSIHVLEMMHRKQFQARQKYKEKKKKDYDDRKKLMKNLEQEFRNIEQKKAEKRKVKKMIYKQKETELEQKRALYLSKEKKMKLARMQQLSEKDEQYVKRKQELADTRKSQRKEKESEAIEKWKRRQSYCLKMMEEKKLQIDRETQERQNRIENRNEKLEKGRRKMEKALEKSTQMSRESAMKQMESANSFLEKAEARKEAEIMRWREKYSRTSKKQPVIADSLVKAASCDPIDFKEKAETKNLLPMEASPYDDLNVRLAILDDANSERMLSSSFKSRNELKQVSEEAIPHIEVIECMESNHSDMVFDEIEQDKQAMKHSSSAAKSSTAATESKLQAEANTPEEVLSVSNIKPDASVRNIAKDIAKLALMRAAGQLDFDVARVKSAHDKITVRKDKRKHSRSNSNASFILAESTYRNSFHDSLNRRSKLNMKSSSKIFRDTDDIVSTEANRLAENAVENVTLILGCEKTNEDKDSVDGNGNDASGIFCDAEASIPPQIESTTAVKLKRPSPNSDKRPSILLNPEEGLQFQAKNVTKKAIVGAVQQMGHDESTVVQVSGLIDSILNKDSKVTAGNQKDFMVHFDEDSFDNKCTPRNRSTSISERIPTPHASYTRLVLDESLDNAECPNDGSSDFMEDTGSRSACKRLDLQESKESVESSGSTEKREKTSQQGRRATPFFTTTEKKNILADIRDKKGSKLMETFGEEEEEEEVGEEDENVEVGERKDTSAVEENSYANLKEEDFTKIDSLKNAPLGNVSCEVLENNGAESSSLPLLLERSKKEYTDPRQTVSSINPSAKHEINDLTSISKEDNTSQENEENIDKVKEELVSERSSYEIETKDHEVRSRASVKSHSRKPSLAGNFKRQASIKSAANDTLPQSGKSAAGKGLSLSYTEQGKMQQQSSRKTKSIHHPHDVKRENASVSFLSYDTNRSGRQNGKEHTQTASTAKTASRDCSRNDSIGSSKRQTLKADSIASGIKLTDASSQKTLESTSSHFLPKIRPSRSRMVCNLDPSVYSCTSEEISDNDGPNSQDILDNNGEKETVVKIEQRSEIDITEEVVKESEQQLSSEYVNVVASTEYATQDLSEDTVVAHVEDTETNVLEDKKYISSTKCRSEEAISDITRKLSLKPSQTSTSEIYTKDLSTSSKQCVISSGNIAVKSNDSKIKSASGSMLHPRLSSEGHDNDEENIQQEIHEEIHQKQHEFHQKIQATSYEISFLVSSKSMPQKLVETHKDDLKLSKSDGAYSNAYPSEKSSGVEHTAKFDNAKQDDAVNSLSEPSVSVMEATGCMKETTSVNNNTSGHDYTLVSSEETSKQENELESSTMTLSLQMKESSDYQLNNADQVTSVADVAKIKSQSESVFLVPSTVNLVSRKPSDARSESNFVTRKQSSMHKPRPDTPKPSRSRSSSRSKTDIDKQYSVGYSKTSSEALTKAVSRSSSCRSVGPSNSNRGSLDKLRKSSVEMNRRASFEMTAESLNNTQQIYSERQSASSENVGNLEMGGEASLPSKGSANKVESDAQEAVRSRQSISRSRSTINEPANENKSLATTGSSIRRLTPKNSFTQQSSAIEKSSKSSNFALETDGRSHQEVDVSQEENGRSETTEFPVSSSNNSSSGSQKISMIGKASKSIAQVDRGSHLQVDISEENGRSSLKKLEISSSKSSYPGTPQRSLYQLQQRDGRSASNKFAVSSSKSSVDGSQRRPCTEEASRSSNLSVQPDGRSYQQVHVSEEESGRSVSIFPVASSKSSVSGKQRRKSIEEASRSGNVTGRADERSCQRVPASEEGMGRSESKLQVASSKTSYSCKQTPTVEKAANSESTLRSSGKSHENASAFEEENGNLVASRTSRVKTSTPKSSFTGSKIYVAPINPGLDFTASIRSNINCASSKDIDT